jgi:hypothetical protein
MVRMVYGRAGAVHLNNGVQRLAPVNETAISCGANSDEEVLGGSGFVPARLRASDVFVDCMRGRRCTVYRPEARLHFMRLYRFIG